MSTRRYLLRKVFAALVTLVFVLVLNFFLFRILPGDPVRTLARNQKLSAEQTEQLRAELGLDKPLPQQFLIYMRETVTGNLGISFTSSRPVTEEIGNVMWNTILLVGVSTVLMTIIGIWVGIRGAWRRGSRFDIGSLGGSLVLYSMPEGWLGMMLLILFGVELGWFPVGGYESTAQLTGFAHIVDVFNHLFLPMLTLTLGYIGEYAIIMRSSLLEVMNEEFVTTARAKGLRDKFVRRRHAVPNALLPTVTLVILNFGYVFGGAIVVEYVFSWPGLGKLTASAITQLDYPVIQGVFLIASAAVIFANLIADVLYTYLDPRVREG
ncbi:MAG: ABC transporter permease [Actinomycetota bacterium]